MTKLPEPEKSVHEGTSDISIVNEVWRLAQGGGTDRLLPAFQIAMSQRVIAALDTAGSFVWPKSLTFVARKVNRPAPPIGALHHE